MVLIYPLSKDYFKPQTFRLESLKIRILKAQPKIVVITIKRAVPGNDVGSNLDLGRGGQPEGSPGQILINHLEEAISILSA